jgi:hypothetical protein
MDYNSEHRLKIGTIDAIRVIMSPLNFDNPDYVHNYEVLKIKFLPKYVNVYILEDVNIFWNMKFERSLINSLKDWLKQRRK